MSSACCHLSTHAVGDLAQEVIISFPYHQSLVTKANDAVLAIDAIDDCVLLACRRLCRSV